MQEPVRPDGLLTAAAALELLADEATRNPVLITVDDAHSLDIQSVEVLAFVARRLGTEPVALVIVIGDGYDSMLVELGCPELRVGPLDRASSAALVDRLAPKLDASLRRRILDVAAGNPLALVELSNATASASSQLSDEMPISRRLSQALLERFVDLPPATQAVLLVAAADEHASASEVLCASELYTQAPVSMDDVGPAEALGLVARHHTRISFRLPLLPVAIYQAASPSQRQRAHAALGRVVRDAPARQAWHRAASVSGTDEDVASQLERALSTGHGLGARARRSALERAAALTPEGPGRAHRLLRAAELAAEGGERRRAGELLAQVDTSVLGRFDELRMVLVRDMLEPAVPLDARWLDRLVDAAEQAAAGGEAALALRALETAAMQCWWSDAGPDDRRRVAAAVTRAQPDRDGRALRALAIADPAHHAAALRRLALSAGPHHFGVQTACALGTALHLTGAFGAATTFLTVATSRLRKEGWLCLLAPALVAQAWGAVDRADWDLAGAAAEEAEALARESHQLTWLAAAHSARSMVAATRGDADLAEALLAKAESVALPIAANPVLSDIQAGRAAIALGRGGYEEAFHHLCRSFDPSDPAHHYFRSFWRIGDYVEAAVHTGRVDDVRDEVARAEELARTSGSPRLHVALLYARALLPDDGTAVARFSGALDTDLRRWPLYRARLLLEYGTWLRRHRKIAEARMPLRAARDAFESLGATAWAGRARQELRASRETHHRDHAVWTQLTEQEQQIASLAAQGLSNREIGQRMYISHRTVGSHLYRIFPKLGIASRAQLQAAIQTRREPA
jgi:DNA-binding CsgD family transcriptional regulator